jgi:hypothetical protein
LKFGNITGEAKNILVAAQDQAPSKNCIKNKILKEEIESIFGLCKKCEETTGQDFRFGRERIRHKT